MARRKEQKIKLSTLECRDMLIKELSQNPLLADFDMNSIEIKVLYKTTPYIKDIDRAVDFLQRYYSANKDKIQVMFGKQIISSTDLAKMMRVSRPTVNKWIKNGFIKPSRIEGTPFEYFQIDEVIEQLRKQKQ